MPTATKLHAVHQSQVAELLERLGVEIDRESGMVACGVCGTPTALDDLGTAYRRGDEVIVTCRRVDCIATAQEG
jgi:hypothetical protein